MFGRKWSKTIILLLLLLSIYVSFNSFSLIAITKTRLFKYIDFHSRKIKKQSDKNPDIFDISAPNIDCGYSLEPLRRGGSNEYPQSLYSSKNKKNNVYPCKPQIYYIKLGFKGGSTLYRHVFVMVAAVLLTLHYLSINFFKVRSTQ